MNISLSMAIERHPSVQVTLYLTPLSTQYKQDNNSTIEPSLTMDKSCHRPPSSHLPLTQTLICGHGDSIF
jgi:hypothetical protein